MLLNLYWQTTSNKILYKSCDRSDIVALWRRKLKPSSEWLSRQEVCEYLFINLRTLTRWKNQGLIKPIRMNGRVLYHRRDVLDFQNVYLTTKHYKLAS